MRWPWPQLPTRSQGGANSLPGVLARASNGLGKVTWLPGCNPTILPVMSEYRRPVDVARRMAARRAAQKPRDSFRRETFALPREAARAKARELFARFPKAAYMTEIESWRVLPDDRIEFTMRRLPSAD